MRILVIHSNLNPDQDKRSAVDQWRIVNPIRELRKHVDWTIDERPTLIPDFDKYKDKAEFTAEEMERAFEDICTYDIVFSSYQANPTMYTLLKVAADKAGTQYVMDVDDDMFAINPDNPIWTKMTDEKIYFMQRMIADNAWISTTTEELAEVFRKRRKGYSKRTVTVVPNCISDEYPAYAPDNGDKLVIGYMGGSTHYKDVHNTGFLEALERIMHEYKHVHFKSVGMIVDKYLPRARVTVEDGKKGDGWLNEVYPSLNFDISCAPLLDNLFNHGKSDIKWQESTRMGAQFVCSDIGPYSRLDDSVALKTSNGTDNWYEALKTAVEDAQARKRMVAKAQAVLQHENRLEDNWIYYKRLFETVHKAAKKPDYATI